MIYLKFPKKKDKRKLIKREKEKVTEPRIDGFELNGKIATSIDALQRTLLTVSFLEVVPYREGLAAINVETKDIKKRPYLFSVIYFNRNRLRVMYSIVPGTSPKLRRLEVLSYFLNIMSLVSDHYHVDMKEIYQFLQDAIKGMSEYVTQDYEKIFAQHDMLKEEVEHLRKEIIKLKTSNDVLSRDNYNLKRKLEDLSTTLKTMKTVSDETLAVKLQEWISEHDGEINITEFAKVYDISEARIEQMLNRLITRGFLELK